MRNVQTSSQNTICNSNNFSSDETIKKKIKEDSLTYLRSWTRDLYSSRGWFHQLIRALSVTSFTLLNLPFSQIFICARMSLKPKASTNTSRDLGGTVGLSLDETLTSWRITVLYLCVTTADEQKNKGKEQCWETCC